MNRTIRLGAGAAAASVAVLLAGGLPASADNDPVDEPDSFTSMFTSNATPDAVLNPDGVVTPGEPGASGTFNYRINSDEEIICWDITVNGVTPPYQSMARTATHIHEGPAGASGPPRLSFPDPTDAGDGTLQSSGCWQGPFTTGLEADGADTGTGFSLAQIEADPANFYTDTHTSAFVAGAVRGQLSAVPMGGVDTGGGGMAGSGSSDAPVVPVAIAAAVAIGGGAFFARRRMTAAAQR